MVTGTSELILFIIAQALLKYGRTRSEVGIKVSDIVMTPERRRKKVSYE